MELRSCALCGNLFQTYDKKICPKCAKKEEEYYDAVKKLIKEKPTLKFMEIIKETGCPERLMRRWMQEGRLEMRSPESIGLKCESCNKSILQGKYCVECRQKIQSELGGLIKKDEKKPLPTSKDKGTRMRFLD